MFSVLGTALLFYTSPQLTLLTLLAVPPIVLATSVLGRRVKMLSANVQQAHAEAGASATEVLAGIRTVRAFSQEAAERSRYEGQLARALEFVRRKVQARALLGGVSLVAGECAALLAIWVGGHFIVAGRMTTGGLISFILYALLVARGFRNASRFTAEALRAVGATQWIFELLERTPLIPLDGGAAPADLDGSIALEEVRFRYPSRPDVEALRGVDLRIEPGEIVALVGKSGSGKSTLLNLILRFYNPTEGRVLVGGRDVRELNPASLRSHVATVMQEPTLFSRTIAANIGYGATSAEAAEIERAAALASADEFIGRLPSGYATAVGDRGAQLSGGQRQRLAIARAILRRPRILVLDEATSALDAELDSVVQIALRAIDGRPTTLIIAHRLSTVANVDRVIVLDQGRIVESGTHEELIHTSTFYRQFVADSARRSMSRPVRWYRSSAAAPPGARRPAAGCATGCASGFPNLTSAARPWCSTRGGHFRARRRTACAPTSTDCSRSFTRFWARWRTARPTERRGFASSSAARSTPSPIAVPTGGRISSNRRRCISGRRTRVPARDRSCT